MLLSVIVPRLSKGVKSMLERELKGIDSEIVRATWSNGIKKAKGDFVCLLETDSAVERNTIRDNLEAFTSNPSYRKLAMVSPRVDLPDASKPISWTYSNGLAALTEQTSQLTHAVRIGNVPGAIIRKSSLLKIDPDLTGHPWALSLTFSVECWKRGLRIALNPETLYYVPEGYRYKKGKATKPDEDVLRIWDREMIS